MAVSLRTSRACRVAAIVGSVIAGIGGVFTDYDTPPNDPDAKHIFTDVQASTRDFIDKYIYNIDTESRSRANAAINNHDKEPEYDDLAFIDKERKK